MSNEMPSDRKLTAPEQLVERRREAMRQSGDPKLTRVAVKHLFFSHGEYLDVPDTGMSQQSNIHCLPSPPEQSRYFLCDYLPAWGVFELAFYGGPAEAPKVLMVPAARVSSWKRI